MLRYGVRSRHRRQYAKAVTVTVICLWFHVFLVVILFFYLKLLVMTADLRIISKKDYDKMKRDEPFAISYGFQDSPFGKCLMAVFGERICHISFVNEDESVNLKALESQWPKAHLVINDKVTREAATKVFLGGFGARKVLLKGTVFEGKVWQALTRIPRGTTVSYEDVATMSGHSTAVRAAANAVAKNSVAYLVPCHRVIRKDGSLHKYQWGSHIKQRILDFESDKHSFRANNKSRGCNNKKLNQSCVTIK